MNEGEARIARRYRTGALVTSRHPDRTNYLFADPDDLAHCGTFKTGVGIVLSVTSRLSCGWFGDDGIKVKLWFAYVVLPQCAGWTRIANLQEL